MNYSKIYSDLIDRAKNRTTLEYTEKHHIIPKCLGGNNKNDNIVRLTYREHFLCHWLLCKIYPDNYKLKAAFCKMTHSTKFTKRIVTSKQFEIVKRHVRYIEYPWLKEYIRNHGPWNKGKTGVQVAWNKNKVFGPNSKESNEKRSETLKKRYSLLTHPRKNKDPWNKGKTGVQVAWNKGISEPKKECPHCFKLSNPGNYSRWHGDKCKMK
jgi:hypothetical protein